MVDSQHIAFYGDKFEIIMSVVFKILYLHIFAVKCNFVVAYKKNAGDNPPGDYSPEKTTQTVTPGDGLPG